MRLYPLCLLLSPFFFGVSCLHEGSDPYPHATTLYSPEYAEGFTIKQEGTKRILYMQKSWLPDKSHSFAYVLYPREDSLRYKGEAGTIPYPLQNIVCLSTTHIAYLDIINQSGLITGISGSQYVSNQYVRDQAIDVGFEGALNYELLLSLHPDVVFAYGISGASASYLKPLAKMGIQVVYMGDYLESHPLGKAEYMVAFSAFFGSDVMEKSIVTFRDICDTYLELKVCVDGTQQRPKVLMNAPFKDVWFIPGSDNYMSRLISDAGGTLLGSREGTKESQSIGLEQAFIYALEADFWLHPNAFHSLEVLGNSHPRFVHTPAFIAKQVYNNTRRSTQIGGSDFWEKGVTEPHIILADLIKILHPELMMEHEWVYYEALK